MEFDADAFISYAHLDNVELAAGHPGWVTNLQRALAIRLAQLLGAESRVWWDMKLRGNDELDATFVERLKHVAALVTVISPRYIKSEWCRREITEFCKAAEAQGGVRVHESIRIFKVLKTVVPLEQHPPELKSVLGYEFYHVEPATGRVRELDEIFGPEAERDFWIKLDDLAHDLRALLESVAKEGKPAGAANVTQSPGAVYLAETTTDLKDSRDTIKRDLEQHGYTVLPNNPLPVAAGDVDATVREALARCRLSIHLVGKTYSLVPEGGTSSLIEMQNELAIARSAGGGFSRLVWIPPGLRVDDDRQKKVLDNLRMDPRTERAADVLETPLQDLRTLITAWLKPEVPPAAAPGAQPPAASTLPQVYLICDQRDTAQMSVWSDFLFKQGCEVLRPIFDGDETDIREYHEENLRTSDGIVIFYGSGNELWLRRKLREVQKSAGYGRTKPNRAITICLVAPKTPEKEQFNTHEAALVAQWDGLTPEAWQPFLARVKGGVPSLSDDAAKPA